MEKLSSAALPPEWSRILHGALVMKKEIDNPPTQQFIQRVVLNFLRSNEIEDLKSLPAELEEGLITMLKGGMAKRRKTNPVPTGDCSVIEDTSATNKSEPDEWMSESLRAALEHEKTKGVLGNSGGPTTTTEPKPAPTPTPTKPTDTTVTTPKPAPEKTRQPKKPRKGHDWTGDGDEETVFEPTDDSYEVLTPEGLQSEARKLIDGVVDFLGLPNSAIARCLLRPYKWNKEELISAYIEDSERVCKKAGVPSFSLSQDPEDPDQMSECLVCMDEYKNSESFALPCGHRYCALCWQNYLEVKVGEGPDCIQAKCMAPSCPYVVHEDAFKKCCTPDKFEKYAKFLVSSFVEDNPFIKWCPAPGCTNAIRVEQKTLKKAVTCKCGFRFCFQCSDGELGDHLPASCDSIEKWQSRQADESSNVSWLLENTKKCPNCKSPIEKNGGCMHMTCHKNAGGCGHEFCWLCRGPWSQHGGHTGGYYACNKYEQDKEKYDSMDKNDKAAADRYMFYFHRYESHKEAMKIAAEQKKNAAERGRKLAEYFDIPVSETEFLIKAATQIFNNRRTLQWTYVYGFFATDPKKADKLSKTEQNLFEYLQEDLEKHTNYLSELYENLLECEETPIPQVVTTLVPEPLIPNPIDPTSELILSLVEGDKKPQQTQQPQQPQQRAVVVPKKEATERELEEFQEWKGKVSTYTKACLQFLDNLNEGIAGGLTGEK